MPARGGVLDASVLLAVILGETPAAVAEPWFVEACMSTVNLSEVIARLAGLGYSAEFIAEGLAVFDLDIRSFDQTQAERAGLLRPETRRLGLSVGDRACLALAVELGRSAVTADKAWAGLDLGIQIELIR